MIKGVLGPAVPIPVEWPGHTVENWENAACRAAVVFAGFWFRVKSASAEVARNAKYHALLEAPLLAWPCGF